MVPVSPDLLASPIYEVLAGQELKPFLAHGGVLAKSDHLKALIDGSWKGSVDGVNREIKFDQWDVNTVGRWLQWLYSGDYTSPYPELATEDSKAELDPEQQAGREQDAYVFAIPRQSLLNLDVGGVDYRTNTSDNIFGEATLTPLSLHRFDGAQYQHHHSSTESLNRWIRDTTQPSQMLDYEATLLAHASIYCFAEYLLLPDLQVLAFEHLKTWLIFIDPLVANSRAVSNLVTLVKYVYANTRRPRLGEEEPLQKLLTTFIALNAINFRGPDAMDLLENGGDIAVDIWSRSVAYTRVLKANNKNLGKIVRQQSSQVGPTFEEVSL